MNSANLPAGMLVDLDDTIIDDSGSMQCWVEVCSQAADRLNAITGERLFAAIDARRQWLWSDPEALVTGEQLRETTVRIVTIALGDLGIESPDLARQIGETYRDLRDERLELFPGAIDALSKFRKAGVRLAMLTNGAAESQRAKIERFDLARYFDCIIVEGEFGAGKPETRVYVHALDTLGVTPDKAWCIGDSLECDVAAPMALGIYGIWHDPQRTGLPADSHVQPDRIIHSLTELAPD